MKWNRIDESEGESNYDKLYTIVMAANDCIGKLVDQIKDYAETGKMDCNAANDAVMQFHKVIGENQPS